MGPEEWKRKWTLKIEMSVLFPLLHAWENHKGPSTRPWMSLTASNWALNNSGQHWMYLQAWRWWGGKWYKCSERQNPALLMVANWDQWWHSSITALVLYVREGLKMDHNDSSTDKFGAIRGLKMSLHVTKKIITLKLSGLQNLFLLHVRRYFKILLLLHMDLIDWIFNPPKSQVRISLDFELVWTTSVLKY